MSDNFDHEQARRLWQNSRNGLFDFAEYIATASDLQVQKLARSVRRSPSLLYGYKKAGELWLAILSEYPMQAELWRDQLEIGFWTPLARLWKNEVLNTQRCVDLLLEAMDGGLTVEDFQGKLPTGGSKTGIIRKLSHVVAYVEKYIFRAETYGLNCDQEDYARLIAKLADTVSEIKRILAASGGTPPNHGED